MRSRLPRVGFFASVLLASIGWSAPAPITGIYTNFEDSVVMEYRNDGTKREAGPTQNTYTFELNADGSLRAVAASSFNGGSGIYYHGAWQMSGDRLFFISSAVDAAGRSSGNPALWLGSQRAIPTADGLTLDETAGTALLLKSRFRRTTTAALGPPIRPDELAMLKTRLNEVVRGLVRPTFSGAHPEAELNALVQRAVSTGDVSALLQVSYPTAQGLAADPQLGYYLTYVSQISPAFPGTPYVSTAPSEEVAKQLASMQPLGAGFPDALTPRGAFWIGRKSSDGRGSSAQWYFYGEVGGQWAIFGSPIDLKRAVQAKTR